MAYLGNAPSAQYAELALKTAAELAAEKAVEDSLARGSAQSATRHAAVKSFRFDSMMAGMIDFVGGIGIAAWQFMSSKKRARRSEKQKKRVSQTQNEVTSILNKIYNTGMDLVDQGVNPATAGFEQKLYDLLFQDIGYRGNCNAIVWVPGSKPGKDRPIWFRIDNNGRTLTFVTPRANPPNLQSYWYSQCMSSKTDWIREYQRLLVANARDRELSIIQAREKKVSSLVSGGLFGVIGILGVIVLIGMMRSD